MYSQNLKLMKLCILIKCEKNNKAVYPLVQNVRNSRMRARALTKKIGCQLFENHFPYEEINIRGSYRVPIGLKTC